jgi:hypothetical protein
MVTCRGDCGRILDWMTDFSDTLYTQVGTTRNYSAVAVLHTSQSAVTDELGSSVFTSPILATDFITVSLLLLNTHEFFFSQPNSFQNSTKFLTETDSNELFFS